MHRTVAGAYQSLARAFLAHRQGCACRQHCLNGHGHVCLCFGTDALHQQVECAPCRTHMHAFIQQCWMALVGTVGRHTGINHIRVVTSGCTLTSIRIHTCLPRHYRTIIRVRRRTQVAKKACTWAFDQCSKSTDQGGGSGNGGGLVAECNEFANSTLCNEGILKDMCFAR